jgi:hypothetical protein
MFAVNPFAALSGSIPPAVMQGYIVLMIVLVAAGTLFDILHKGSARYFFESWRKSKGSREVALLPIAIQTVAVDVLASGEFCNAKRRFAHLLTMYGFVFYVVATVVLVFNYTAAAAASFWPQLWWLGGAMVFVGGTWFWFFIRVDVAAEGNPVFRVMHADLFILSMIASVTLGLLWAWLGGFALFALYILATTVLFAGVPWSKFAHMFFKPAAAFEKRVAEAGGTHQNLPTLTRDDPEQRERHSMELLKDAPMDMGLGIKREPPHHY